jgi:S-DNA-T family DNA segregation ATPase FtsK/SpoIIIE
MISRKDKKFLLALTLISLSFFLLGSLVPVSSDGLFPSANIMGQVGARTRDILMSTLGLCSIFVCLLMFTVALRIPGWISKKSHRKFALLWFGLLLLGPVLLKTFNLNRGVVGQWGELIGTLLITNFGKFAPIMMVLLLVPLFIYTIRWNPIADIVSVVTQSFSVLNKGFRWFGSLVMSSRLLQKEISGQEETMPLDLLDISGTDFGDGQMDIVEEITELEDEQAVEIESIPDRDSSDRSEAVMKLDETTYRPPTDSLERANPEDRRAMKEELRKLGDVLIEKLKSFDIEGTIVNTTTGPVVTQYEVEPAEGVKVSKIQNLEADLALAMKAKSVRIIAPIPGKGAVGVEIPNPKADFVMLGDILESSAYSDSIGLPMALGKDLNGEPYIADLTKMPHILIAGATGTGKSVCLNAIITSLIFRHGRETLDLLMVDPKMVELSAYKALPHLRKSVVTDPNKAARALKWAVIEMERRYKLLSLNGVRSIGEFNQRLKEAQIELNGYDSEGQIVPYEQSEYKGRVLTYIVVVIDELADLMMTVKNDIEKPLITLAQKARAIGIHLIVATQRPSVNVITGLIKANFPSRIAFRVASKVDSRTILDQNGAEALLGDGDMLFLPPGANEPVRIQGAYISTDETDSIMSWYVEQRDRGNALMARPEDESDILEEQRRNEIDDAMGSNALEDETSDWDELFRDAAEVCIVQDQGSTSLLQRRLKIGYGRAARIVDQLHDAGVLGPPEGSKGREILVGMDQLDAICGDQDIR